MTRDDIIKLANSVWQIDGAFPGPDIEGLKRFAKLVAEVEREKCIKTFRDVLGWKSEEK